MWCLDTVVTAASEPRDEVWDKTLLLFPGRIASRCWTEQWKISPRLVSGRKGARVILPTADWKGNEEDTEHFNAPAKTNQNPLKLRSAKEMARQSSICYDLSCYVQNCNLRKKIKKESHPHHMAENVIKSSEFFYCYVYFFYVPFGAETAQSMPLSNRR